MTDTKTTDTAVIIDPATSVLNLAKAKAKFLATLEDIQNGTSNVLITPEEAQALRDGMTEQDNDAFDLFMDEEVVRMNDHVLDSANASTELRNCMVGYIEDAYLKLTNKGRIGDEKKSELIEKLSGADTLIMMDYISSEVAEAQIRTKLRANGYNVVEVIDNYTAMQAAKENGTATV